MEDDLTENGVVSDNFSKLGEVPWEPLLKAHDEGVDVLVHGLNKSNGLDDGFVLSVNIGGALLSWVLMGKT